jgi:hypothetical protein
MPKDFDRDGQRAARLALDRDFIIGGEHFKLRSGVDITSKAIDAWRAMFRQLLDDEAPPVPDDEFLATFYGTMEALLMPDDVERFKAACAPRDVDPITVEDAFELVFWAVGVVTGRPTAASTPSADGPTQPTTAPSSSPSTPDSSSPEAQASTA